jgi:glutathione synthase/RimK-type ligase-like ATP-grasp enzyme
MKTVGVLAGVRREQPPPPPADSAIGRAALHLLREGIRVIVGDRVSGGVIDGFATAGSSWTETRARLDACYDRFPAVSRPAEHAALLCEVGTIPLGNPPEVAELCRDKLALQRRLEAAGLELPEVEGDPARFAARLAGWGAAFLKPPRGSFGEGVARVRPGHALPEEPEAWVLQRAVAAPAPWAGVSVRALIQREPDGSWTLPPPVARRDPDDPVVNVARSAEAVPAADALGQATLARVEETARAVGAALGADPHTLELGLDFAVDPTGRPWLIEVNGRPCGRLEVLAARDPARFGAAHLEACARPLATLAATC